MATGLFLLPYLQKPTFYEMQILKSKIYIQRRFLQVQFYFNKIIFLFLKNFGPYLNGVHSLFLHFCTVMVNVPPKNSSSNPWTLEMLHPSLPAASFSLRLGQSNAA